MQRSLIDQYKPVEFVTLFKDQLNNISTFRSSAEHMIPLIAEEYGELLNNYHKDKLDTKYKDLFDALE